ncbi:MAG: peptidyl-prolyl cis-trans isomerase [Pyrinomonadaceae bacterium]
MLKFFKRMERTRNFILFFFAIILVGSLILFYSPTQRLNADLRRSSEVVANVNGEKITIGQVVTDLERSSQSPFGKMPASIVLDGLIANAVVRVEARKLKLTATDQDVATKIRKFVTPQDGKPFDQKQYEQYAIDQAGSVPEFEEGVRDQMSRQNLSAYLTSGVEVSEADVFDDYKRKNTKFDLVYVPVNTADLIATIKPTDEELQAYFQKNQKSYYINSPQKKVKYIFLSTEKLGSTLKFSDEELKKAYDALPADKKLSGVKVQEIVLRVNDPAKKAEVQNKATEIVANLKTSGDVVSQDAFATAAKGQSEKPSTALTGGEVKGLVRENPNNPTDPYQQVLTLKEGEVTDPIDNGNSIYILRRGEAVAKPFDQAKKEIEVSKRNQKAYEANSALAGKVDEALKQSKDVDATAKQFASQANMAPDEMIRETGYVKPGDDIENLGISQDFEEGISGLNKAGEVGGKIPVPGGFAVPIIVDVKPPRDANFDEVKDQVAETYKANRAREQVEAVAKRIAENAGSVGGLTSAASGAGLTAKTSKDFILGSPLGEGPSASTSKALEDAIFALGDGEYTKVPIESGGNWYVVGVNGRQEASKEEFDKDKDQLITAKANQDRMGVFTEYLTSKVNSMKANGDIKIDKSAMSKINNYEEENKQQTPQQIPGLPPQVPQQVPQPQPDSKENGS